MLRPWVWLLALTAVGPGAGAPAQAASYVVSLLPVRGLVSELAGPDATVECLVGPGESPETFEPTSRQITGLARADAVFTAGLPFEDALLSRVDRQFPDLRRVDVTRGIVRQSLPPMAATDLDHDHDHAHGETDPHVWTGPAELRTIVANVAAALTEMQPQDAAAIARRRVALDARIAALELEIEARLLPYTGRSVLSYHPAFGYFCHRYGLRQLAVESGGTEPGARHIVELAGRLRREGVTFMVAPPQFSPDRARTLARSLEVEVVIVDPLQEDVEAMLREFTEILVTSFAASAAVPVTESREGSR